MAEAALGLDGPGGADGDGRPSTAPATVGSAGAAVGRGEARHPEQSLRRQPSSAAPAALRRPVGALVRAVQSAPPGRSKALCNWLQVARTHAKGTDQRTVRVLWGYFGVLCVCGPQPARGFCLKL
jgi:hypothetical protein